MLQLRHEAPYLAGFAGLGLLSGLILAYCPGALLRTQQRAPVTTGRRAAAPLNPPRWFEQNLGQTDPTVQYLSRGRGCALFLTPQEAVLSLRSVNPSRSRQVESERSHAQSGVLRMKVAGRRGPGELRGEQPQAGSSHYFLGNDPSGWRVGVPHYSRVRQRGVYPGIDLVYYEARGSLEFDFVVSPGANPRQIELAFSGQRSLSINKDGDLSLDVGGTSVRYERPLLYQQYGARRVAVSGRYQRRGRDRVGFEVAANYDPARPLIIDPVLNYSTFLGDTDDEQGASIAVDAEGNTYITGTTQSSHFPTTDGLGATPLRRARRRCLRYETRPDRYDG